MDSVLALPVLTFQLHTSWKT